MAVASTLVLTQEGYLPIEHVEITDKLMPRSGLLMPVQNIWVSHDNTNLQAVEVSHRPLNLHVAEALKFYVRTIDSGRTEWRHAASLTSDHFIGFPINTKNISPTDEQIKTIDFFNPDSYQIPEWIQNAPVSFIEEYLRQTHMILTTVKHYSLALNIQRLFLKIGKICSIIYNGATGRFAMVWPDRERGSAFVDPERDFAWFRVLSSTAITVDPQEIYNFECENYCLENSIVSNL